ncbi:H-NS histone family protein [compost metagenome]
MPRQPSNTPSASPLDVPASAFLPGTATEKALLRAATKEAYKRVGLLLDAYFEDFSPAQQRRIREATGANARPKPPAQAKAPKVPKAPKEDLTPRFWLPFSGETWSGRGRPPAAFLAWEGTVAHTEWKKRHPGERFPAYPA